MVLAMPYAAFWKKPQVPAEIADDLSYTSKLCESKEC